jgi:hypothetical protein
LSGATLYLIDGNGTIMATELVGNTCGQGELIFGNFSAPTPAPTVSPSYSPTASLNLTSSLVKDFSWVGKGECRDESYNYYSYIYIYLSSRTTDTYYLDWCSQNPHPDLVGVQVNRYINEVDCFCLFSGGVPEDDIDLSDYQPEAYWWYDYHAGEGAIQTADGYDYSMCYRYDVSSIFGAYRVKCLMLLYAKFYLFLCQQ